MTHYELMAASIEMMREALRAMVAGLMQDGFTEEQAREITTAIMSRKDLEEDTD